jgi:hypothetical protein
MLEQLGWEKSRKWIEHHPGTAEVPEGYQVEFFTGNGETITVVSIAANALRSATHNDVLHVRELTRV